MKNRFMGVRTFLIGIIAILTGLNAYQFQNDDVATLRGEVSDLTAKTSTLSRVVSDRGSIGISDKESRTIRMFVLYEVDGSDPCSSPQIGQSVRDFYLTDMNNEFFSLGFAQGNFEYEDRETEGCILEFLFIGVPRSSAYQVRPLSPFQGIASSQYPIWEVDASDWGDYEEVWVTRE